LRKLPKRMFSPLSVLTVFLRPPLCEQRGGEEQKTVKQRTRKGRTEGMIRENEGVRGRTELD